MPLPARRAHQRAADEALGADDDDAARRPRAALRSQHARALRPRMRPCQSAGAAPPRAVLIVEAARGRSRAIGVEHARRDRARSCRASPRRWRRARCALYCGHGVRIISASAPATASSALAQLPLVACAAALAAHDGIVQHAAAQRGAAQWSPATASSSPSACSPCRRGPTRPPLRRGFLSSSTRLMVRAAQSRRWRLLAIQARDHAGVGAVRLRRCADGREVALEVAAGDAQAGREIGVLPDAPVELERRHDLAPVGADALAQFRQRIGDADRATRGSS